MSIFLTGPMLIVGAFTGEPGWRSGVAALIDLATPTLLRRRLRRMHYDAGHLAERFGLFVLIALGESVVAVGLSADPRTLDWAQGFAVAAAFIVSCGLWWVYFYFAADAVRHALATAEVQLDITRLVLSYGHLSFIAAIILSRRTARIDRAPSGRPVDATAAVGGGALYLATFGFTRWAMFRLVSWTRLTAAAVVVLAPRAQAPEPRSPCSCSPRCSRAQRRGVPAGGLHRLARPPRAASYGERMSDPGADRPAPEHRRPEGVDDLTVEALGKLSEALEVVENARGYLYAFHRLTGMGDLALGDAVELLEQAGHYLLAGELRSRLIGRNVIEGRWTFQVVEEYDDGYYRLFKELEAKARDSLVQGKRHLFEAEMKEERRTHGDPDHTAVPAGGS